MNVKRSHINEPILEGPAKEAEQEKFDEDVMGNKDMKPCRF